MLPSDGADFRKRPQLRRLNSCRPLFPTRYGNGEWQDTDGRRASTKYIPS